MDAAVAEAATSEVNNESSVDDMDWDNIEETAPSVEAKGEENEEVQSEEDSPSEDTEVTRTINIGLLDF